MKVRQRSIKECKDRQFAEKMQEQELKKVVNDQFEYAYKQRTRQLTQSKRSKDDDPDSPKKKEIEKQPLRRQPTNNKNMPLYMKKEDLGNQLMTQAVTPTNKARERMTAKAKPPKQKRKRKTNNDTGDAMSVYTTSSTVAGEEDGTASIIQNNKHIIKQDYAFT